MSGKSLDDLGVVVSAVINVRAHDQLPKGFLVEEGLGFHLKFNGESHPARVVRCENPIEVGDSGRIHIMFTALEQERNTIKQGLPLEFIGGLDILFGDGEILKVIEI